MHPAIYLCGPNDAVLCDCGAEFTKLDTMEIDHDLYVFEMYAYLNGPFSVEQELEGIRVSSFATPISMGNRMLRATRWCKECVGPKTFEISFNGNVITGLEPVNGI